MSTDRRVILFGRMLLMASLLGLMAGVGVTSATTGKPDPYLRPALVPAPADNAITPARVALGKALFFDPRLSGSQWISCASCHNPALGWSDGLPTAIGDGMKKLPRRTPTILNVAYNTVFMWDGRAASLEDQATGPIKAKDEMDQDMKILVDRLMAIPGYAAAFERAYPGEGITEKTIAKALASFERTVISADSPFDRWRAGNEKAVDESAKRGFKLFTGKAKCDVCHEGFNFTDNGFHNIGLKTPKGMPEDVGRYAQRKVKINKGAFKTSTLRDVALTAPYMHNGIYRTLEEVIDHYDRGGDAKDNLSPNMEPLNLTSQEKKDLLSFLKSLTGTPMHVMIPQLPR
jgi:cytochrome c peroxidase